MNRKSIFINGNFYIPGPRPKRFQALAAVDGKITEMGDNSKISPLSRRGYKKFNLKRRFVLPAFTDAHLHLSSIGRLSRQVNLEGVDSLEKALKIIKKKAAGLKPGEWLKGRGWNKNLWGDDFPNKSHLDSATSHPAVLGSKDGHLIWANSAALKACGIHKETPDPPGGIFEKDNYGELTGIIKETAADLIYKKLPSLSRQDKIDAILEAQKKLLKLGIIGVGDFDTWPTVISKLYELELHDKLKLRVFKMIYEESLDEAIRLGFRTGVGGEHFRAGCLKLFGDGALGSQTAYMFEPYAGSDDNFGVEALSPELINKFINRAVNGGISVAIHAIGDKANHIALHETGIVSKVFSKSGLRPRIEHAQLLRRKDIGLFAKYNITASVQPIHATSDRDVADRYWGKRARYAYPFKSLLKSGASLAFGSDAPIENADPIAGIHAAVTRKRADETRAAWYPCEKIAVSRAIEAYTVGSAKACCFDDITGNFQTGKAADFVVLSDDILRMRPGDIYKAGALATVVDGRIAHGRNYLTG